jgi:hypothetical protein
MPDTASAHKAGRRAALAIRRTWRMETTPAEVAVATRMLADMPLRQSVDSVQRLAAVGAELQHLRAYLVRLRERVQEGEVPLGGHREEALLDDVVDELTALLAALQAHYGPFPGKPGGGWNESGVRETFVVEIAEDRVEDCRALLQWALQASDAQPPEELLGRAYLRAVAEDLDELDVYLVELAAGEPEGELKRLLLATQQGCRAIVGAIAERLPALGAPEEA